MPDIRFYNTLSNAIESFEPIDPPRVTMYNCGPTVYDFTHIGNFKSFLFADVLRRFLELAGYDVHQVMNITDVGHMTEDQLADGGGEDKMQVAAERLKAAKKQGDAHLDAVANPDDPYEIASFYADAFIEDARALRLKVADEFPANTPRATDYIKQMQALIERLIDTEHAYVAEDGAVYYAVESFPDYGRLSGNTLEHLRGGAGGRVRDEHQRGKRHPADFLLWKPDASHLMKWDSPWGAGYPGWHIECSAMARAVLGRDVIDIHTGGEDNIFPHHECEIAQTRGATGEKSFARFWIHGRHLMVEGEKMSKSKGNFYSVREVLEGGFTGRAVDPAVLRYELIRVHYRSNTDVSVKGMEDSAKAVRKLRDFAETAQGDPTEDVDNHPTVSAFIEALADDLNTAKAIGVVFEYVNGEGEKDPQSAAVMKAFDSVLAVLDTATSSDGGIEALCEALDAARAEKNFEEADALRQRIIDAGYDVQTTKDGTVASKRLA